MSDNTRGALAMALAMFSFCANDTVMKLVFAVAPLGQTMVVRGVFAIAFVVGLAYATGALKHWRDLAHPVVALRGAFDGLAAMCFLTGLSMLPLTTLMATLQGTPLIATAMAAILFAEKVGWRRWLATAVGLVGVLIVIDPFSTGADGVSAYALFGLAASVFAASRDLATRQAPAETPTIIIAMAAVIAIAVVGAAMSVAQGETWVAMDGATTAALAAAAIGVVGGNYFVSVAMRVGDVSVVSPARYSIVIWATLLGWLAFAETPTTQTIIGATITVAAGLYTLQREQVRRRPVASKTGMRGGA